MQIDIDKELAALRQMTAGQLGERYREVFGEPTHSRHRSYLIRKIAWRLQTRAEGDLSERARKRAAELAKGAELRVMPPKELDQRPLSEFFRSIPVTLDPRLPIPGSTLVRNYKGRNHEVLVREDYFEFEGERYPSLTAVAEKITASHCNGFRFFKLGGGK
jgi:hypothetical protein